MNVFVNRAQRAAYALAAACETFGLSFAASAGAVQQYLTDLGFNPDAAGSTSEEAYQLEELCEAFSQLRQHWDTQSVLIDDIRFACHAVESRLRWITNEWHAGHSLREKFSHTFKGCVTIQELEEYLCGCDRAWVKIVREMAEEYAQKILSESKEDKRLYRQVLKTALAEQRETMQAIRAKARLMKNEHARIRVVVEDRVVVDVSPMRWNNAGGF